MINGYGDLIAKVAIAVSTLETPSPIILSETSSGQTIYYWQGLDLLGQSDGTNAQFFQYDGLGSVRQLADAAGAVQYTETFDPYGNLYASAGMDSSKYAYTGEQQDANGLLFLRARYFNATNGRFSQIDTQMGTQQQPQSFNPYMYVIGDPVLYTDPSGHDPWWCQNAGDFQQIQQCLNQNMKDRGYKGEFFTDERAAPWGIVFDPAISVPLALGLPENTNNAENVLDPFTREYGKPAEAQLDWNSCGTDTLAMILRLAYPSITAQDVFHTANTESEQDKTKPQVVGGSGPGRGMSATEVVTVINTYYKAEFYAWREILDATDSDNFQNRLRHALSEKLYPMPLVTIDRAHGNILSVSTYGANGTGHWLVVTGLSRWDQWVVGPQYQWVRVNNPFDNEVEYWPWSLFSSSLETTTDGNLVIVAREW